MKSNDLRRCRVSAAGGFKRKKSLSIMSARIHVGTLISGSRQLTLPSSFVLPSCRFSPSPSVRLKRTRAYL